MKQNQKHIRHKHSITKELKTEVFGDMDIFEFGNIVMLCAFFSTFASLALYAVCVYCI